MTFVTFFSVYLCCSICVVCVAYLDRITKVADIFGHDSVEKKTNDDVTQFLFSFLIFFLICFEM